MMTQRLFRTLALLVAAALMASACGSDGGDAVDATDTAEPSASANASDDATSDSSSESEDDAMEDDAVVDEEPTEDEEATTVSLTHYSGTDDLPVNPETIVVMDLGILITLDSLGITADGFGSLGTPVPAEYEALTDAPASMGTAFEPDLEAIAALEPDLIIVATRSSRLYPDLKEIAPTVDLTQFEEQDFFTEFSKVHQLIAQIFPDTADDVASALSDIEAGIADVAAQAPEAGSALVLMTTGAEVTAFGPGYWRFGLVYDLYGFGAADESLQRDETHGEAVSYEFIANAQPDVLFVVDRAGAIGEEGESAEAILDNALVDATPAGSADRIVYVDSFYWYLANNSIPGFLATTQDMQAGLS